MARFKLQKWYFDCINSKGEIFIGYAAKLQFGLIKLNYGSIIIVEKNGKHKQKQSFNFGKLKEKNKSLEWLNDSLNVNGKWFGKSGGNKNILYEGKEGRIVWQCLKPNANVLINHAGKTIEGLGYVEKLYMTLPPWKLPFNELRWGRFISTNQKKYFIWIDWKGKLCKSWVWSDSGFSKGDIKDNVIITKKQKLILKYSRPIRLGNLADSLFGNLRFLSNLFPRKLRKIEENKFLSRGQLFLKDRSKINGWSINELVKWN